MNECGKKVLGIVVFSLIFLSCGIEEYVYLEPISTGNIDPQQGGGSVIISLPNSSYQSSYFTNYSIYYRIYLSNTDILGSISEAEYTPINPRLSSDFDYIEPYTIVNTDDTTMSPSNVYSTFRNRNYNTIAVEGINIETLLNNTADNKELILDFLVNPPVLTLNDVSYTLRRSLNEGNFDPEPDYTFRNSAEIRNRSYITDFNKDVQELPNTDLTDWCYVSLYIVKEGVETAGFTRIYSFPTFLGVFRLPGGVSE